MTLTIETGAKETGANSFVTEAELTTYLTDRGYTLTGTAEPLLIRAFDLMCSLNWIVNINCPFSFTDWQWELIKKGQCEIAYQFGLGLNPSELIEQTVKREKVDVLETEYFANSTGVSTTPLSTLRRMLTAYGYLKGFLSAGYIDRA